MASSAPFLAGPPGRGTMAATPGGPPSTCRPTGLRNSGSRGPCRPPGTVPGPPPQTLPPRTSIQVPDRWGAHAGAKTLNWYLNRQLHPHAAPPRPVAARNEEEDLEQQLEIEAEMADGMECLGYISSQVMNEHPSELPDFDRRMWATDPFYGWRTQDREIEDKRPKMPKLIALEAAPVREMVPVHSEVPIGSRSQEELPPTEQPTWAQWFTGASPPPQKVEKPQRPAKSTLPDAKHLVLQDTRHAEQDTERPSPRLDDLRSILEPVQEMAAAGLAWADVDDRLWEELHSVGELRRAAKKPEEFPGRLRKFSAHFSGLPPVSMPLEALLTSPGKKEPADATEDLRHQGAISPVEGPEADGALAGQTAKEDDPKPKKKKKDKKDKKDDKDEGCQVQ